MENGGRDIEEKCWSTGDFAPALVILVGIMSVGVALYLCFVEKPHPYGCKNPNTSCLDLCSEMENHLSGKFPEEHWMDACMEVCLCSASGAEEVPCPGVETPDFMDPEKKMTITPGFSDLVRKRGY